MIIVSTSSHEIRARIRGLEKGRGVGGGWGAWRGLGGGCSGVVVYLCQSGVQ